MCSNCKGSICGGRGAIAYQNNGGCGCQHESHFHDNDCGCGNSSIANDCGCGNNNAFDNNCGCGNARNSSCGCGIINSLSKGFACTAFRLARGLDRSLSCGCGGNGFNGGCGCN